MEESLRQPHLDDNAASEFVAGSLSAEAVGRVEAHLARCRECRALVAALAADAAHDSNVATVPVERLTESQVAQRPTRTLTIGDRVGRYLVLTALGSGGMGVVFAAYDPQLDRKVALKLLRAGITYNTKDARTRLRREAQAIAQLSHPNVVSVYDVGETDDGDLYIAMEFVEGDTLTSWLKSYPRTWREIVEVFVQAARGLAAAHSVGLLHRDFKPDNVLVGSDGRVRVTDFGLARSMMIADDSGLVTRVATPTALNVDLTATGTVLGTPRYMAPEQLVGPDIDARADQFGFCVALYEALYGVHPLPGATSASMLERREAAAPPPERSRVPVAIGRALTRGLERERSKRFPAMAALIDQLVTRDRRGPARYAIAAAGLLVVASSLGGAILLRPDEPPAVPPVDPLIERLNRVEAERREVLRRIEILTHERTLERTEFHAQLESLSEQLRAKDEQIQELLIKRAQPVASAKRPVIQSYDVTSVLAQAERDLEGCFVEWNERVTGPADLVVKLRVNADGDGHSSSAAGTDSEALRLCVAEAIARVKFPRGAEVLDLQVNVQWDAGVLNLSARIVERGAPPRKLLDL